MCREPSRGGTDQSVTGQACQQQSPPNPSPVPAAHFLAQVQGDPSVLRSEGTNVPLVAQGRPQQLPPIHRMLQ